jgi:UDP-glucuronate 4-epimerase
MNLKSVGQGIDVEEIDITDGTAIDRLVGTAKPVAILHLAAMAGVRPSIEQPAYYARVNVEGTTHLLQGGRQAQGRKVPVRQQLERVREHEQGAVPGGGRRVRAGQPVRGHQAGRRAALLHVLAPVQDADGVPAVLHRVRPAAAAGPGDPQVHPADQPGEPVPFFGDGTTSRDYTFVEDTVAGITKALERCDRYRCTTSAGAHR